ncbi:phosphate ABC transporter substrate-binding protein [Clostridium ganghwense]|uniref:Phosphate-binding protein n=1 Tax=Clostridium ganghwense TaxID=312089 RepID=A0ABT4CTE0_9CLOT|nr:phosphate ABC transporter substrate-binding protein [Clostridium ganghwense]MCY6372340.1 phosphate ABC transporter substrate-binding protein [Clostridium ganghwense]
MKRKSLKIVVAAMAITLVGGLFAGCGKNAANNSGNETAKTGEISGSITASGSSALQPLAKAAADMFMQKHTKAQINVQGGGSGTGLSQVAQGAVNIGNSDLYAEEKLKGEKAELAKDLVDHKVCAIGFAIVANKDIKVDSLTKAQIQDIFEGKITNWKEVGGDDLKIEVINRGKSSGTRATFIKTVMDSKQEADGIGTTQDSSGAVQKAIEATEGSISYLALSYFVNEKAKNGMKLIKIEEVEATKENITSGKYPFWAYEHMYTKGEPTGLTKTFLDYMVSDEVKPIIEKKGYIPASDIKVKQ